MLLLLTLVQPTKNKYGHCSTSERRMIGGMPHWCGSHIYISEETMCEWSQMRGASTNIDLKFASLQLHVTESRETSNGEVQEKELFLNQFAFWADFNSEDYGTSAQEGHKTLYR